MKQLYSLYAVLLLLASNQLSAQIYLKLDQLSVDTWAVSAVVDEQLFPSLNTVTGSGQVTLVFPAGQTFSNFASITGQWNTDALIVSPVEAPENSYVSAGLGFDNGIDYVNGVETPLFSFKLNENLGIAPRLFCQDDPFQIPNSVGTNPGNDLSIVDIGLPGLPIYFFAGVIGDCGTPPTGESKITGTVLFDEDNDCYALGTESTLAGWKVRVTNGSIAKTTFSNQLGKYTAYVGPGNYDVTLLPPSGFWQSCGEIEVPVQVGETVTADLKGNLLVKCPGMTISVCAPNVRPCDTSNYYVAWCNEGTGVAENAYLTIALDESLSISGASVPFEELPGNMLKFELGDVYPGECGNISIEYINPCDAVMGKSLCAISNIFPNKLCLLSGENYTGPKVFVAGTCDGNTVDFSIQNIGGADMSSLSNYRVIKDALEIESGTFQLAANASQSFSFPADGATYRLQADEAVEYPLATSPSRTLEGCNQDSDNFTTGLLAQFPTPDYGDTYSETCIEVVNSFDPNDKHGFPAGYGAQHLIEPNTDLQYRIRFQNTGTDTAFRVVILDTLSDFVNPATVIPGASSHPYRLTILNDKVLEFDFIDIMLPDSIVNEEASHGFVSFTVSQQAGMPLGSEINNTAAIYFDANEPVFTNTTSHVLGHDFVELTETVTVIKPGLALDIFPNPFKDSAVFDLGEESFRVGELQVFNLFGQLQQTMPFGQARFVFQNENLTSGNYFFKIMLDGAPAVNGKLSIVE